MLTSQCQCHGDGRTPASLPPALNPREPIAIVGIGCRFPGGANDPSAFWRLLEGGTDAITEVPSDRWSRRAFHDPDPSRPGKTYSRWGGFVEGIDRFDPGFFGISPREATRMDPQQRMLLEVAWESLEDAGLALERVAGSRTSVFVGISSFDYAVLETSFRDRGEIDVYSNPGGSLSIAANRISYSLDLRGPSASVDTACSSAMVAVHLACRSIWQDGCPMAIAGGVNALLLPDWYVGFCRMGMLSPEGRCRAFDAGAGGFVRSEGAGAVVLKPMSRAIADGDRIYAVIRGTAMNQDGRTTGMTMPGQPSQEELIRQACRDAGVSPATIRYVEAHGTGTPVGDPIEARALGTVLSEGRPDDRPCVIGSVKTNIGHLEAGSGIAGLIKTALALHHRRIPGNLHFDRPNPEIDFNALRLRVPTRPEPWPAGDGPLLAGVNSFGFGGTNAHAILQEAPAPFAPPPSRPRAGAWLIPISARSPEALRASARSWGDWLATCPEDVGLVEIAANAAIRRTHHEHRLAIVARTRRELSDRLRDLAEGRQSPGVVEGRAPAGHRPTLAFICAGQGPQWWAMGRQLLGEEPVFRSVIERCDAIVRGLGDWSLLEELTAGESRSRMEVTAISQPCIFALQVALAELWASWGVRPDVLIGHSVGEVAAAYLAGVFSLEDAVRVIYHRGRCMELAPERGRMLAASVTPAEAADLIRPHGDRVALAAINGPSSVTLSGESGPLEEIAARLEPAGVFHRFLRVGYAFHSAQMDPIRDELLAALEGIRPGPSRVALISTVTGRAVEGPELGPEYWWDNVRRTVRFAEGVDRLVELGCDAAVELSPHPVLSASLIECAQKHGRGIAVLPSLRRHEDERATMLHALGGLHAIGYPVDWGGLMPGPHRFIGLPLYPWRRERFWYESEESRASRLTPPSHPLLGVAQGGPRPTWESRLDLRLFPELADHRVQRAAILPATAYLELALAAGREALGADPCEVRDVQLANPCFLAPDQPLRLQTTFDREQGTVQVHTRPVHDDRGWTIHLTAHVQARPAGPEGDPAALEAIRIRCPRAFDGDGCYDYLSRIGLDYGPMFRGIKRVWQGDRESLGLVELPEALDPAADAYLFHPAMLDACLQAVVPADGDFDHHVGGLYLPHEIESARLFRRPGRRVWVHARLLEKTPRRSVSDVDIYDEDGRPIATVRGLRSLRVAGGRDESLDDLLYAYQWRKQPPAEAEPAAGPSSWLIFADEAGLGDRLAGRLESRGDACTVVPAGCTSPEELRAILASGPASLRGIVHLGHLDATATDGLDPGAVRDRLLGVIRLVQAWDGVASDRSSRLYIVTRGAQSVGDRPEAVSVAQSPAIGLGRVIAGEYPKLRCKLVDLDPAAADGGAESLLAEIHSADEEDEVAWRGSERLVHRYLPAPGLPSEGERGPTPSDLPYRLAARTPGTLDGLLLQATSSREPGPGEVAIDVVAAGLNFSDVMKAMGLYPGLPDGPVALGAECSGRIAAVGEGVNEWRVGDEVLAVAGFAFGSRVLTRAELVAAKPPGLSFAEAATIPIAFLTASYALEHLGRLSAGETVLIHAASGGVGLAAVQLARRAGAEVLATAGTPEKRAYLAALGIRGVMDSRTLDFADRVLERTGGRGVDVILNSLPGEAIRRGIGILADYGRFLEIGKRDIYQNARLGLLPFHKNLSFSAIDLDRVIRERPSLVGSLLRQIVRRVADGELTPLPHQCWPIAEAADAFRFMQQGRHIGKVVLTFGERPSAIVPDEDEPIRFRADGTYLITGGLGGFGLAVARWMATRGAGNLVLMGRRGLESPGAREAVAGLEQLGARVVVHAGDVARDADVAAVLAAIDRDLPPLRGVLHAAMVLEDALLVNLDRDRLDRVLAPKLAGTWNLHARTTDRPLDLFVMFSSLSSVFGHAGQANYAAANAFLDAMAWHRRAAGLPALTINWGHLGEVGYLARRSELGERLERQGVLSFSIRQALALLEKALQRRHVQLSVMRVEWSRWRGLGVSGRPSLRFAHLCGQAAAATSRNGDGQVPDREAILAAEPGDRPGLVGRLLRDKLARVLGTSPDRLDGEKPLLQLGIDSLMAVELRNWLESELRVDLPIVELMRSPSLSGLAEVLAGRLDPGGPPAEVEAVVSGPVDGGVPIAPTEILARIEDLSGDQVDALLATLLNGDGHAAGVR